MDYEKEVLDILREKFDLSEEDISKIDVNAPLFIDGGGELGLDSIDALEFVVGIKEHFGIRMTDQDMEALQSLATVVEFIKKTKGAE